MMHFITINLEYHAQLAVKFRRDSFKVSFGEADDFDEAEYLGWLKLKITDFPEGFVMVEEHGTIIGQLELSLAKFENRTIGYVNLFYLEPSSRNNGKGRELHNYAMRFFRNHHVDEYHLRVAPTNAPAIRFYQKMGMIEVGPEVNGKVIRMKGLV